jgi:predicted ATP-grasp superfamily ATP-dependent carboligase
VNIFAGRTLIVAFEGWNDAAESASAAAKFIAEKLNADVVATVDPEDYYDFQFTRPSVSFDADGNRQISWPSTDMCAPSVEIVAENSQLGRIHVLLGVEPSRRWQSFTAEVMEMIEDREIDSVLFLGAMLADVPHTRPISVSATSQNEIARNELNLERSHYEGPVGILSVLGIALEKAGIPSVALWASVPHYVHNTPSPKATLALLVEAEKYLGVQFDHGSLADEAFTWERGIDEVAEGDEDMAGYIAQLEKNRDEVESPAASGDALAMEFEKFLRASDEKPPEGEAKQD